MVVISEVFGPTFQGEGPSQGRQAMFIRLGGCNLSCSWCDTPYTWNWKEYDPKLQLFNMSVDEVVELLPPTSKAKLCVITGGEPLNQRQSVSDLVHRLYDRFDRFEVETNGTRSPGELVWEEKVWWNVSPKLTNSGLRTYPNADFIRHPRSLFKFVCNSLDDFAEINEYNLPDEKIWIMPQGKTLEELEWKTQNLAEAALKRGWNFTMRLHVRLWNELRGH